MSNVDVPKSSIKAGFIQSFAFPERVVDLKNGIKDNPLMSYHKNGGGNQIWTLEPEDQNKHLYKISGNTLATPTIQTIYAAAKHLAPNGLIVGQSSSAIWTVKPAGKENFTISIKDGDGIELFWTVSNNTEDELISLMKAVGNSGQPGDTQKWFQS